MKKAMIGYQVYSARDDAQKDLFGTLKSLKEMGYDGYLSVECFPYPDGETAARRALQHIQNCMSQL